MRLHRIRSLPSAVPALLIGEIFVQDLVNLYKIRLILGYHDAINVSQRIMLFITGEENYANQKKYGASVFKELNDLQKKGFYFQGKWHKIDLVCCSDWKCGSIMEGLNGVTSKYFCRYCLCTKELMRRIRGNIFNL